MQLQLRFKDYRRFRQRLNYISLFRKLLTKNLQLSNFLKKYAL